MPNDHIIIIGAGAAGLMAAYELSSKGKKVTVLEGRDRLGGRIHTIYDPVFGDYMELGAEFIHGDLPVTKNLLNQAGIGFHKAGGEMLQVKDGGLNESEHFTGHWGDFEKQLEKLEEDITLNAFLDRWFREPEYDSLRDSVRRYAAGFDTADPAIASALALGKEWLAEEDDGHQYRTANGYGEMINYLATQCAGHGASILLNKTVTAIKWQSNIVAITTSDGATCTGNKVIVTVPLGVLQATTSADAAIAFSPELPGLKEAIAKLGMGAIIKILLKFKDEFWVHKDVKKHLGKNLKELGFILSKEAIPTWWTQYPLHKSLLTGWLGGPAAAQLTYSSDNYILGMAISSLANIFKMSVAAITGSIISSKIINWSADPYSKGSYSYPAVGASSAVALLSTPIAGTIYFAGEAIYDGDSIGTVEAALVSAKNAVSNILSS